MSLQAKIDLRVFKDTLDKIDAWMDLNPGRWQSRSHFIRSAVEKFCRDLSLEDFR